MVLLKVSESAQAKTAQSFAGINVVFTGALLALIENIKFFLNV